MQGKSGIFIVGHTRSGTSLLLRMLDGHPEIQSLPGESFLTDWCGARDPIEAFLAVSKLGKKIVRRKKRYAGVVSSLRERVQGPCSVVEGMEALLEALTPVLPPQPQARFFADKTPRHRGRVELLAHSFGPETRFVLVARDPRAIFASKLGRWPDRFSKPGAVRSFAREWLRLDMLAARYKHTVPNFHVVRYEDLVLNARETLDRLADFLGIEWNDVLLSPTVMGRAWKSNTSFGERISDLSERSLDRYRETVPVDRLAHLEALLGDRMRDRGYDPEQAQGGFWGMSRAGLKLQAWRDARRDLSRSRRDPPPPLRYRV